MANKLKSLGASILNSAASFVIFGTLVTGIAFAATVWPSSPPAGEVAGGKFSSYFAKIGTSCPTGQALQGFTSTFDKTCVAIGTSTVVNGACGSANGTSVTSAPTSGLCSAGTASSVTGSGPWSWSCASTSGGTSASCSASVATASVTYAWSSGAWGSCTLLTSPQRSSKTRTVQCKSSAGSVVADSYCTGTKPGTRTGCCTGGTQDVFNSGCSYTWTTETAPGSTLTLTSTTVGKNGKLTGTCSAYPGDSTYAQWSKFSETCQPTTNVPASSGGAGGPIYLAYGLNGTYILGTSSYSFSTPFSGGCAVSSWPACPYGAVCGTGQRFADGKLAAVVWQLNSVGTITGGWGKCITE